MDQRHIHKFPVDYMYIEYSLVLDEFIILLRLPVDSLRKQVLS